MAQKRLGRGLDSLISNKLDKSVTQTVKSQGGNVSRETLVPISSVEPNKDQPRTQFDEKALEALADSIKVHGIIQPIVVRENGSNYEIIAGERRWRAARLAGLKEVPVLVRNYSEQEVYEVALIENIQRQNLNAIEEAVGYQKLMDEYDLKQEEVATRIGKSRAAIANSLRLLKLEDGVKQLIIDNKLSAGQARALVSVKKPEMQLKLAEKVVNDDLSVRDVEELVKGLKTDKKDDKADKKAKAPRDAEYENIEENLQHVLGTKVTIKDNPAHKGKIEIEFYSLDELERIISQLMGQ